MAINLISSKTDSDKKCTVHVKSDNTEIMMGSETDETIKKIFSVDTLYYNLNKISLNRGGSYIDSPEWLQNKKATTNPKNNDDKCFQYALTVALNYQNIKNNRERISKIKPFIDQYNWKEINFPSHKKDWKKFE